LAGQIMKSDRQRLERAQQEPDEERGSDAPVQRDAAGRQRGSRDMERVLKRAMARFGALGPSP
jgi:hypothetical protein